MATSRSASLPPPWLALLLCAVAALCITLPLVSACPTECSTCSPGTTVCTACKSGGGFGGAGFFLSKGACVATCPDGTYADKSAARKCAACSSACTKCSSATSCSGCKEPFALSLDACVTSCPAGTVKSGTQCIACPSFCSACTHNAATGAFPCQSCMAGHFLLGDRCVQQCPTSNGFYVSGSACRACIGNCNSCINAQVCTQCAGGFLLLADQTGCVASCPPGFAPSNFVCKASPATTTPAPSPTGKPNGVLLQIRLLADVATVGAVGFKQMLRESVARSLGIEATRVAINAVISASSTTPSGTKGGTALIELGGASSDSGSASDGDSDSDSGSASGIAGGTFLIELQAGAGTGTGASSQVAIVIIDSPTDKTRTSLQLAQTLAAFAASASSTFATDMVSATGVRVDSQFTSPTPQVVAACYDGTYSTQCPLPPSGVDLRMVAIVIAVCAVVLGTVIAVCVWNKYVRNHEAWRPKSALGPADASAKADGADADAAKRSDAEDRKRLIGQQPFIDA